MESDHLVDGDDVEQPSTDYNALFGENETKKFTQKTVIGEVRNWKRFSWLEWIFIAVASVSILGVLGITIERFIYFENHFRNISMDISNDSQYHLKLHHCSNWTCTNDFILTVVVIVNLVFCVVYVTDGLLREKMFEIVGYCVAVTGIMVYIIANYVIKGQDGQVLRLVRLIVVVVGGPINIILASIISYKMGYFVFSTIGSNNSLIRAYKIRSFLLTLQYFLLQVMVNALTLAWARDGDLITTVEKVILCLLLAHCFIVMLCGWTAVMFENKWVALFWYFLLSPYYAYFTFKIINVGVKFDKKYRQVFIIYDPDYKDITFAYIGVSIIVLCVLGLIVMALLNAFMLLSLRNFRKGLKDRVPPPTDVWLGLYRSSIALLTRERHTSAAATS